MIYDYGRYCEINYLSMIEWMIIMTFNRHFYKTFPFWCGLVILGNLLMMTGSPVLGGFWWYHVICTLIGLVMVLYSLVATDSN